MCWPPPFIGSLIIFILIFIHVIRIYDGEKDGLITDPDQRSKLPLRPRRVFTHQEFHRLLTGPCIHFDWVHLSRNLFFFFADAIALEAQFGSLRFAGIVFLLTLMSSWIYVLSCYVILDVRGSPDLLDQDLIGFSATCYSIMAIARHKFDGYTVAALFDFAWTTLSVADVPESSEGDRPPVSQVAHCVGVFTGLLWCSGRLGIRLFMGRRVPEGRRLSPNRRTNRSETDN
jgi:membrane associated rhomboid family serine protease